MKRVKRRLLFVMAALAFTGCGKGGEPEPTPPTDTYAAFKADATPRWESGTTVECSEQSTWNFVTDTGGSLFTSDKYKTGRTSVDGNQYELIEFNGPPAVGNPSGGSLRTPSGATPLHRLEIVQISDDRLWIVFQQTANSAERKVVQ